MAEESAVATTATDAARRMWQVLEPLHAVSYFASEPVAMLQEVGLKGFWMTYFAGRAAPMGAVSASVVDATFYNFAPRLVHRAIPDAWAFASPAEVLAARQRGVSVALHRLLGDVAYSREMGRAIELLGTAVEGLDTAGRPLAAANAALPLPEDDPMAALWQLATVVREHRGDGHVALLVAARLDGCQAHVSLVATGALPRGTLQSARGWEDEEWEAAEEALSARGWLDGSGAATEVGRQARARIEHHTDRLAAAPWQRLGPERTAELALLLAPWARAVWESGVLPASNPIGLPARTG